MATSVNVQNLGDEAIYTEFPNATGTPSPASGRSLSIPSGYKELRTIKDATGKVIWAHKWRLTCSGDHCSFAMTSTDPKFTQNGNIGRCKNGNDITVTVNVDSSASRVFDGWSDGNRNNPRVFDNITNHMKISAKTKEGYRVTIRALSSSAVIFSDFFGAGETIDLQRIPITSTTKAVIDALQDFTPVYDDATNPSYIDLTKSGFRGWTLDRLKGTMGSSSIDVSIDTPLTITGTTVIVCSWTKQINNKFILTSSAKNNIDQKGNFFLYQLATNTDVALPVGGKLYISDMYGLLTHTGTQQSHQMCVFVGINDITDVDDTKLSDVGASSGTTHNDTSWKLAQEKKFTSYTTVYRESVTSGSTLSVDLKASTATHYDDGTSWDTVIGSKLRPFAPRSTPFSYDDWIKYVFASVQFEPSVTNSTARNEYVQSGITSGRYQDWSTLRTIFTTRKFNTSNATELDNHVSMISGGSYQELTDSATILDTMTIFITDNYGHDKSNVYVLDCCSMDYSLQIPSASIGQTFYDYLYQEGVALPGYNWQILKNDPDDPDELIVVYDDSSSDATAAFEQYTNYYFRTTIAGDSGTETVTYYIQITDDTTAGYQNYVYPAYHEETVGEYKTRVAGYLGISVSDLNAHMYTQTVSTDDAIYVTKATGAGSRAVTIHYQQTSSSLSIPQKLGSLNPPAGIHLKMFKTNNCPVQWKFFIYSLKINLY